VFVSLLWSAGSAAQTASVDDDAMAPLQPGSMLSVWGTTPLEPGRYAVGLGLHVREAPVSEEGAADNDAAAGAMSTLELLATIGLWRRIDISAGVTAHSGKRDAAASQAALGDVRVVPRLRLVGADTGFGLAIAAPVWVPAGNGSVYRQQGARVEPRALASYSSTRLTLSAQAGYFSSLGNEGVDDASTDAITVAVGADALLLDGWSVVAELPARWLMRRVDGEAVVVPPVEPRAAVRFSAAEWMVQLGGGLGVGGSAEQPEWRLLAAVGFTVPELAREKPAAPPRDRDGDGVADASDACPDEAAIRGASDMDGCPFASSEPVTAESAPLQEMAKEPPSAEHPVQVTVTEAPLARIEEVLYFELNEMKLQPAQLAVLALVEAHLRSAPADTQLVIEGHSDSSGPASFNSSLSRMRASTVRLHLIERGISWRRLLITARGSSQPVELDIDAAGRALNRRVVFRLTRIETP
jgi:OmpA-OmpF porin, OOP family